MWNRAELKQKAKIAFKRNYWKCVVVALIALVLLGSSLTWRQDSSQTSYSSSSYTQELRHTLTANRSVIATGGTLFTLLGIFVIPIFEIGCDKFFVRNATDDASLGDVLDGFRNGYGKNVLTMFLVKLFIVLWTFLLVIPGIVKSYSYMLVPYILADTPNVSRKEAILLSRQLMNGNKMDAFVLDLSFIGWEILNALTVGILGVFYVNPYIHATKAELYLALRYNGRIEQ